MPLRALVIALLIGASAARAGDCEDKAFSCQDDCIIRHGHSTKAAVKERFSACSTACATALHACVNKSVELNRNQLDPGALDARDAGARFNDDDDLRKY